MMTEKELTQKLTALYWSAQTEKERAIRQIEQRQRNAGTNTVDYAGLIQRSMEDIEHSMRYKMGVLAVEYIHSNIK